MLGDVLTPKISKIVGIVLCQEFYLSIADIDSWLFRALALILVSELRICHSMLGQVLTPKISKIFGILLCQEF